MEVGGLEGGGEAMNWLDKKEEAVIMVILPPCYYCLYCMRSRCEYSSVKTESMIVILFC